ncbi:MAG: DUF3422 domain-containing protein [Alphaproteobacteria bacterium]
MSSQMRLPPNHQLRFELADEVHARPPEALVAPTKLTFLACFSDRSLRQAEWQAVTALAERYGVRPPAEHANHYSTDLGPFRLKWERHTEFSRYKFIAAKDGDAPFATSALEVVPEDWIATIPGEIMVAAHVVIRPAGMAVLEHDAVSAAYFGGNPMVGSILSGGAAAAFTDFRIHEDGFSRFLIEDRSSAPRQAGRLVQRLLEIDTYRIMAMLALPVAKRLTPALDKGERELAAITNALVGTDDRSEPELLDRLTRLQAEIESDDADSQFRFSAAAAYYDLVQRRIADLREERIQGLQTFQEFIERRLAPAMNTCSSMTKRQETLSQHLMRATQLLSTRVSIASERQNQAILESMNRRAELQVRLQETVEGLSIAAITYYIVGLVSYLVKGLKAGGVGLNTELITALSIPVVVVTVALGVRKIRAMITGHTD